MKRVYLDNAATTPVDPEVIEAMIPVLQNNFGNPSSIHHAGRETRTLIEQARKTVAGILNVSPSEIFFTSGGTEANNTALHCSVRDLGISHMITSPIEHHAVLHTLQELQKEGKIRLSLIKLDECGRIDMNDLERLLAANPGCMVSLMHANNELGNLLPIQEVGELCQKYNALFHSDTVQTMGHYKIDLGKLPVHFVTCAAHKFHGPKGIGFLYVNSKIKIHPFIFGGAQERNMRGGTENVYGIVGLAKALQIANDHLDEHTNYIKGIKSYMIEQLRAAIPGVEFNGDPEGESLYTVLNVSFPDTENSEMLIFNLDIAGIACSGGSACSSGSNTGSHVLKAVYKDSKRPAVRFSFSKFTTREEIDFAVEKLKELFPVKVM
ncbi:MAG: cysteine desulfurase [Bacteroidetes bacterium]|nr:MAG: cysteine desulfurase [Bacteroidota bacterium]REJ99960.1 MAG: cysteine desulfurase [Bacteroidota bacterium]REK35860.1 MAG: cysteine desulfurase [Bacteroidota bacterium]REK50663.1 MAG: cysteine desulfurase [Bacteroidota bacterium]